MQREEASELIGRILGFSRADETHVSIAAAAESYLPYSANELLQAGFRRQVIWTLSVRHGNRFGSVTSNETGDAAIREALDRAKTMAELLPPVPDAPRYPGKREIPEAPLFRQPSSDIPADKKIEIVRQCIEAARAAGVLAAGSLTVSDIATAVGSSAGLFLYQRASNAHLRMRAINPDGKCSGIAERWNYDLAAIDPAAIAKEAIDFCIAGRRQKEIKPGRHDAILSHAVVADFLYHLLSLFEEREVTAGQSFLSKMDGTTQIGTKLFPGSIRLLSDPADPRILAFPFTAQGEKLEKTLWIDEGIPRTLITERKNSGTPPVPFPSNLILEGGKKSMEELIASTGRGVLVTSVSNLAVTDPTNGLLGGITRDGLFLIEEGKISSGLKNMRFSETPVYMLKGMEEMSRAEQRSGRDSVFPMHVPAIRMSSFTFSATTEIV